MPENFLDLHIVDYCQLNCKHYDCIVTHIFGEFWAMCNL